MRNHRNPPAPEHWDTPAGSCRWCGCCIYDKDGRPAFRRRWHEECAEEYKFIFWPNHARWVLLEKRGERCEDCGDPIHYHAKTKWFRDACGKPIHRIEECAVEHHHIIPLIDYQHDPQDPYAAWREGNLVLLCHSCHQVRHAALRAGKKP